VVTNKKFNFNDKDSPSKILGFTPSKNFEKFPHRVKLLSLANAFDENDLINFEKKIWIDRSLYKWIFSPEKIDFDDFIKNDDVNFYYLLL